MKNEEVFNDVMRKTFPKMIFIRSINERNMTQAIHFSEEWLNEEYSTELAENKGNLISREYLQTAIHNFFYGLNHTPTEEDIQRYIEAAPSVENKGKWEKIWRTDCECSEYVCSKCGCGEDFLTDFCPNCGADMRLE